MKVLVTGSEGTLGKHLTRFLVDRGHEVHGLDLMHASGKGLASYHRADIAQAEQLERVIVEVQPQVVYNLAAEFGRHNGEAFSPQLWLSNAVGCKNMLMQQAIWGFKLVHASSSEVYGEGPWDTDLLDEGVTDRCPLKHHNDYAMSKWVNEGQVRNHLKEHGGDVVVARFFNAYGPGEHYHPYRSVVCLFCYNALHDLPYTVYEGYYRVFMYIADFIPSLAACAGLPGGTVINIGGTEYRSVRELHEIVQAEVPGCKSKVTFEPQDGHNTVSKRPDITLAQRLLHHNPRVSLEEGVRNTLAWMRTTYGVKA